MFKLALLGLLATRFTLAAPASQAAGITCISAKQFSQGGATMDVAAGTECRTVNGAGSIEHIGGVVAGENGTVPPPAPKQTQTGVVPVPAPPSAQTQSGGAPIPPPPPVQSQPGGASVPPPPSAQTQTGGAPVPPPPPVQSQSGGAPVPPPPPAQKTLPGAPVPVPQTTGTGGGIVPPAPPGGSVSGTTGVTPGTISNLITKYQSVLTLGVSPPGVATCPAGPATISYSGLNSTTDSASTAKRYVAYWSAWHGTGKGVLPTSNQLKGVTHLILAFWDPNTMNTFSVSENTQWGINIASELKGVKSDMKVMVAVGGWALDEFFRFNATDTSRDNFAQALADFVYMYKLDGIDMDWEYPVDHGATYKSTRPTSECDKKNNVLLMQSVRQKLDALVGLSGNTIKKYYLSLAVPAIEGDMLAYDSSSAPEIDKVVDFWNLMTYDYTNRRSTTAEHQAGGGVIKKVVAKYKSLGLSGQKLNMGFPMYAKWFSLKDAPASTCTSAKPIGCDFGKGAFEDPTTGADKGGSGTVMFNNDLNSEKDMGTGPYNTTKTLGVFDSWKTVSIAGISDATNQATAAYDDARKIWWSWVTGADVQAACKDNLADVGGVMVWSIDQDNKGADGGDRFDALQKCVGAT